MCRFDRQIGGRSLVVGRFLARGVLALALGAGAASAADGPAPKPRAVFKESTFDFGAVVQGTKVTHDFILKNEGSAPFTIQRTVPGCGCTASTSSASTVPPGGEAKIHVQFDTTGFTGEKTKSVRVLTSDSEHPALDVYLKGRVEVEVAITPPYVGFGDLVVGQGGSGAREVTVSVREGSELTLGEVTAFSKSIKVTEVSSSPTKKVFTVALTEGLRAGEFRDRIVVTTKSPDGEKSINVPVFASIKSEVMVSPAAVSFGVIEGKDPIVRRVALNNFGSQPVTIREIRSSDPAIRGTFKPVDNGKNFVIELSLDPKLVKRDFRASIDVITDRQDIGPVALSVYGIVPPQL